MSLSRVALITISLLCLIFLAYLSSFYFQINNENQSEVIQNPVELKIGFITDIHAKSNSIKKVKTNRFIKEEYLTKIDYFKKELEQGFGPDIIVNNGDVIEGTNRDSVVGKIELSLIKDSFKEFSAPTLWVTGNHDLRAVAKDQWKESLGIDYLWKAFELNGYKIIILDSNFNLENQNIEPDRYYTRGRLSDLELKWLEAELKKDDKKSLIFLHHPPLNYYNATSNSQFLKNAIDFQNIVSRQGNVLAVFSGHVEEIHHKEIQGVHYFVIPGTTKNPDFQGTFAKIRVLNSEVSVTLFYQDQTGKYKTKNITALDE